MQSVTKTLKPVRDRIAKAAAQLKEITGRPLVAALDNPGNRMPLSPPDVIFAMYGDPELVFPPTGHSLVSARQRQRGTAPGQRPRHRARQPCPPVSGRRPARAAGRRQAPGCDDGRLRDNQRPVRPAARRGVRARGRHAVGGPAWPVRPTQRRHPVSRNRQSLGWPARRTPAAGRPVSERGFQEPLASRPSRASAFAGHPWVSRKASATSE